MVTKGDVWKFSENFTILCIANASTYNDLHHEWCLKIFWKFHDFWLNAVWDDWCKSLTAKAYDFSFVDYENY